MPSGPGNGAVIQDYETKGGHFPPPEGSDDLDPYAYDIYSLGQTIRGMCRVRFCYSVANVLKAYSRCRAIDDEIEEGHGRSHWAEFTRLH